MVAATIDTSAFIQYTAWILALVELILCLYILYLNPLHRANRAVAWFMLLIAAYTFGTGSLSGATNVTQARLLAAVLAATRPALAPALLLAALIVFRPQTFQRDPPRRLGDRFATNGPGGTHGSRLSFAALVRITLAVLTLLPAALTLLDILFFTWGPQVKIGASATPLLSRPLWYTGGQLLDASTYSGGYLVQTQYTGGITGAYLNVIYDQFLGSLLLIFLIFVTLFPIHVLKRENEAYQRSVPHRLTAAGQLFANILFLVFVRVTSISGATLSQNPPVAIFLVASTIGLFAWLYAAFQEVISERYLQPGKLQTRLTFLTLILTLPLLGGMVLFLTNIAQNALEEHAIDILQTSTSAVAEATDIWLNDNVRALKATLASPAILSMDRAQQEPVLKTLVANHPYMYLAGTINLRGINVARSDGRRAVDYSDQAWFRQAAGLDGHAPLPVTYEIQVSGTSNLPALIISIPIRDENGKVIGVGMSAFEMEQLNRLVRLPESPHRQTVLIVDAQNRLIIQNDLSQPLLQDLSEYLPVKQLRNGSSDTISFVATGAEGESIPSRAHAMLISNGWGVVALQAETDLFAPIRTFRQFALAVTLVGALLLVVLSWPTIRHAIHPIFTLTDTALAISQGDLSRTAPVQSQDELGALASAFNTMTTQLRDLISSLEIRVSERTRDLEQRAIQLQVAAEVAREAATLSAGRLGADGRSPSALNDAARRTQPDPDQILNDVVSLISDKFGFYHAGIFLISVASRRDQDIGDGSGKWAAGMKRGSDTIERYAVLKAASSDGGRRMLARGHRLQVGREGIVGYVAASGQPRIALDVGQDAAYFNNPDLPQTRSELALPLKILDHIIGVLDVQSRKPAAFDEQDIAILQMLADQVTLVLENARLLSESQAALRELEGLYGRQVVQGWQRRLQEQPLSYLLEAGEVRRTSAVQDIPENKSRVVDEQDGHNIPAEPGKQVEVPINLRGQTLGMLRLKREAGQDAWSQQEKDLLQDAVNQMALSLENARLLEEIRERADQEERINQVVTQIQGSLNLDTVMKTAVQEINRVMGGSRVRLWLLDTEEKAAASDDRPRISPAEREKQAAHNQDGDSAGTTGGNGRNGKEAG